ncbi:MAG TPA: YbaK/EbsC family protein, partial [Bryobacteraceae bacterium]|nr:YbaK/EbsC family protein [Bryobacteraceae bacterium]
MVLFSHPGHQVTLVYMLWSQLLIPTLREEPAGCESVAEKLLTRAGYLRESFRLTLAQRSLHRLRRAMEDRMRALGAQELGGIESASAAASLARAEIRSYRQLPQSWYRADSRGLRLFSFHSDAGSQDCLFEKCSETWLGLFAACGVDPTAVPAGPGALQFAVTSEAGDAPVAVCSQCGYRATLDAAVGRASALTIEDPDTESAPEPFHTPGRKTIAEVAEFTGLPAASQMKSLVIVADGEPVLALVRGDHQMSGTKLSGCVGALEVRPASAAEIIDWFGAEPGSLGPVGVTKLRIIADVALKGRRNMISGANRTDYHLRNVTPGRDFQPEFADIRRVAAGDRCLTCDAEMTVQNMAELGRIAKVANTGLKTQGPAGAEIPIPMGSYSLEFEPILRAAAAQNHDANGLRLPPGIAPFDVIVTPVN